MKITEHITILTPILTIISIIFPIIFQIKGFNKRSLENIKKRFDIYKEIITNKNKVLSYTLLKEYLGVPISSNMIKYILKSTNFYDFVVIWKNIYTYVDYDPKAKILVYKKGHKPSRKLFIFLYIISCLPFIPFTYYFNELIKNYAYLLLSIILIIPFLIVAIHFLIEIGDRTLAIKIFEKNMNSHK